MKLWRVAAMAALVSTLIAPAVAFPLDERWTPVQGSATPADGPQTTLVRGEADTLMMTVHWNCGQASPCIVNGDQMWLNPVTTILIPEEGANTPAPYFMFQKVPTCSNSQGDALYVGTWFFGNGDVVMRQCFLPANSRYRARADALPPVRRVQPPPNLSELTTTARARARARAQPTP
jgi:hypothetical protein